MVCLLRIIINNYCLIQSKQNSTKELTPNIMNL